LFFLVLISPANGLNQWQKIEEKGYLTWVTRPSPLTYYNSMEGVIGLEYDILKRFCENNKIKLTVIVADSNKELFEYFDGYNVDIAGANLTFTQERQSKYTATIGYDETSTLLVSSLRKPKIKFLTLLNNLKGAILNNSSYETIAHRLEKKYKANITKIDGKSMYELMQMVTEGSIDYTLSDENIVEIYSAYIPKLRKGEKLTESSDLVFYIRNSEDNSLKLKLDKYIKKYKFQNKVNKYKAFIVNTLPNTKPADTVQFLKNYKNRWSNVKPIIYTIAEKYKLSPILLGAISYQESHWNPSAVSPTLVKGLMMLTKAVADEQNVIDRFDPLQSLEGGARHFIKMMNVIPERIPDPDKTSFALAAYNLGYGHVEKARVLAQRAGKSPDLWKDVKEFLPLLNDMEGSRADGKTAVRYVENIRAYQNLLQWKEQQ